MTTKFLCAALCFLAAAFVGIECKTRFSPLPLALRRLPKFRHVSNGKIVGGEAKEGIEPQYPPWWQTKEGIEPQYPPWWQTKDEPEPKFRHVSNGKIVGGDEVEPHSIPYQVSLQYKSYDFHFCGGSIITNKTIVTAAHCCEVQDKHQINVVAGEHNLSEYEGTEQVVGVKKIIVHPSYNAFTLANDICVIVLKKELEFNEAVGPCLIPKQDQKFTGDAVVSGWGSLTFPDGFFPDALQAVTVPIVSDKECGQDYGAEEILDSMICAGQAEKGPCVGDIGGPLTCNGTHCGIVSWGYGCGKFGYPGVYTETSHFVSFIMNAM